MSNDRYQGYVVDSSFEAALQLTVAGCEYDRFEDFLQALRGDSDLVQKYNSLKRQWDGRSMSEYRQAKAAFIEAALGQRSERLEGDTIAGGP